MLAAQFRASIACTFARQLLKTNPLASVAFCGTVDFAGTFRWHLACMHFFP
jgi:hypothetical protein